MRFPFCFLSSLEMLQFLNKNLLRIKKKKKKKETCQNWKTK